jgi:hypothetical protein
MPSNTLSKLTLIVLLATVCSWAQNSASPPDLPRDQRPPTVTFSFDLPGAQPGHYSITVASTGNASFQSDDGSPQGNVPAEPYMVKFIVSQPTAKRIFDLTQALNYFQGNFEFHNRVANMGAKTLSYTDANKQTQTTFNYSANPQLQELTRVFQNLANSLEFGRRLDYLHRHDKLGLEAELKMMEEQAKGKNLAELQMDEGILRQISDDHSVMNISRKRADRLLQMIANTSAEQAKQ